jgi:hypothetical protein
MTIQYDVKAAYTGTVPAQLFTGRTRLKQIVFIGTGTAGSIALYDGTSTSGNILWQSKTSTDVQPFQVILPGEGILACNGIYVDATNVTSVTITYG